MSNDDDVIKSGSSFYNRSHTTALNSRRAGGVATEIVQKARSSEASAKAERLIHGVQLEPVREAITHVDLAKAEQDVARSEVNIERQVELIARLRAEGKSTEEA